MRTLYLHIGTGKTGTTALQWLFYKNRDRLRQLGITYPDFGLVGNCHHRIGASFYREESRPYFIQYEDTRSLEEYATGILDLEGDVLISTELLSHGYFAPILRRIIGDADVRIILYLRRQDAYVASKYNQAVKTLFSGTIEEFVEKNQQYLDYRAAIIDGWSSEWGKENLVVRPYEKDQFTNGRIFDDFAEHVFGSVLPKSFELPPHGTNPRLSGDAVEFKRAINNLPISNEIKMQLGPVLQRYSIARDASTAKAFANGVDLSAELRARLLASHRASNAWIARNFLGREDGRLFADAESSRTNGNSSHSCLPHSRVLDIFRFVSTLQPDRGALLRDAVAAGLVSSDARIRASAEALRAMTHA